MQSRPILARVVRVDLLLVLLMVGLVRCSKPESTPVAWPQKEIGVSQEAADSLVNQLDQISHSGQAFVALLTDEELTSYLQLYVTGASLREPTVQVTPMGLYAQATVGNSAQHQVRALIRIQARRGTLRVQTVRATVDGRGVPYPVLECLDRVANAILWDMAWPVRMEQVVLKQGHLAVIGTSDTGRAR